MTYTRALLFALVLSPLSLACGDDGSNDEAGSVDCETEAAPKFSEMAAVWAKCTTCHSSTLADLAARQAAPLGIDFDMYATAKAHAATAADEIEEGAMPPAGKPQLTADEEDLLLRWAGCGTPE